MPLVYRLGRQSAQWMESAEIGRVAHGPYNQAVGDVFYFKPEAYCQMSQRVYVDIGCGDVGAQSDRYLQTIIAGMGYFVTNNDGCVEPIPVAWCRTNGNSIKVDARWHRKWRSEGLYMLCC